jgi:hypothetical protein
VIYVIDHTGPNGIFVESAFTRMAATVRRSLAIPIALSIIVAAWGCEPANLTEARNQLARGTADTVQYVLPLSRDTLDITDLDIENDTVLGALQGIALDPETVFVAVGDELVFEEVELTDFAADLDPAVVSGVGALDTTFTFAGLTDEPRLDPIDSLVLRSGTMLVTTGNRLVEPVVYTVTLMGLTRSGVPLSASGTLPAAAGDGSWVTDLLVFDLADVTMVPDSLEAVLDVQITFTGNGANAANANSAIVQTSSADFQVRRLSGQLDPATTPELSVAVEDSTVLDNSIVDDLGDFEDAVRGSTINTAVAHLEVLNGAGVPVTLTDFQLGAVELIGGVVPRDPVTDEPLYETDDQGDPILVLVADPGSNTLAIPRRQAGGAPGLKEVDIEWAELATRVVHMLIDGKNVAIIGAGAAAAGDGTQATITEADSVTLNATMAIAIDFTIPDTGVMVTSNTTGEALTFGDQRDIDDLLQKLLVRAVARSVVENKTPYVLEIDIAYAAGDLGDQNIFDVPGAVILDRTFVEAPDLTTTGRVTAPLVDTAEVVVPPADLAPLLAVEPEPGSGMPRPQFTATARVRLKAGTGANGRAALGAQDWAILKSSIVLEVKRGGAP